MYHWRVIEESPWALGQKQAKKGSWEPGTVVPLAAQVVPPL